MQNIAEIGFKAKSDELADAKKKLDDLSDAAAKTEKASEQLERKINPLNATFAKVKNSVTDVTGAFGKLAAIIGGALATAIAGFSLRTFIQATAEADRVQAQLANALRSTAGVSGQTTETLIEHASALQKVTNYGDDTVKSAQALLLTFTKIQGDTFPKATEAVLDVATAMRTDLQSAALQVGKALNDPVLGMTALSRSGIQFSEAQKTLVKSLVESNKTAEAQKIILSELQTQFGGSAKAARETLGGAITSLGEAWGDLFELGASASEPLRKALEALIIAFSNPAFQNFTNAIGGALFGAFTIVVQAATQLVNGINILSQNFDILQVAIATTGATMLVYFAPTILAGIASGLVAVGVAGVTAFRAIGVAIAANPIGALATAFVAVVTALYAFRDNVKQALGVDVVETAKTAANFLINSFTVAYEDLKFIFSNLPSVIGAAVIGAVNAVILGVDTMLKQATSGINTLIALINKIPGMALPSIDNKGGFLNPVDNPYATAMEQAAKARASYRTILMAADNFAGGPVPANNNDKPGTGIPKPPALNNSNSGGGSGTAAITTELEKLKNALDKLMEPFTQAKSAFQAADQALKAGVITSDEYAKKIAEIEAAFIRAGGTSEQFAKITSKNMYDLNKELGELVKNSLTKLGDAFIDLALDGKASFSDMAKSIVKDLLKIMWQAMVVQPILNSLFGKNGIFPSIPIPGMNANASGNIYANDNLVPFAKGGAFTNTVVNKPTPFAFADGGALGLMGEAGPEAIMPLQRGPDGSLGVQMYGGMIDSRGGGPLVYVEVINNTPDSEVKRERQIMPDGATMERIIIDTVSRGMAEGEFDKVQSGRYGNQPRKVFR